MNAPDCFSSSYQEARDKFRAAATRAGGALERMSHPKAAPDGGDLTTDVAWFGPREADCVLVTLSGTHGVEGFAGSGAQIDWLQRDQAKALPGGTAALLVHAINPYGFAWLRRVTHDNIDLNRNWIDFGKPLPINPGYDELSGALCPPEWSASSIAASSSALQTYRTANGAAAFQHAVSAGQYHHPTGLFFGGTSPDWSRRTQTQIFTAYLGRARKVAVIDYHTGLGPWGLGEQIATACPDSDEFKRAVAWFGGAVSSPFNGTSASAAIVGDGLSAVAGLLPQAEVTTLALEFGTLPLDQVLHALRADAWLHAHGDLDSPTGRAIKAQMSAAFFGDTDFWKGMVAGQSLLACKQAIAGLGRQ